MNGKIARPCDDCGKMTTHYQHDFMVGERLYQITKCKECYEKREKIYEWQNEKFRENTMICPWCECEFEDYENVYEDGELDEMECPYCGKIFEYEVDCSWEWTTRKPENLYE